MTAADAPHRSAARVERVQSPIEKLKLLKNRKIYYSNQYIFLDHKEFTIVWHNVFLFILLHYYYLKALSGIFSLDPEFAKAAPICKCVVVRTLFLLEVIQKSVFLIKRYIPSFSYALLNLQWFRRYGRRTSSVCSPKVGLSMILLLNWLINSSFPLNICLKYPPNSYKAKLPLRIFYVVGHIIAGQNNLVAWCRDHRVHHKFSDTDADPHNTNRGVSAFNRKMFKTVLNTERVP